MTSKPKKATWGVFADAAKMIASRKIDGFFVPFEITQKFPSKWPGGGNVCIYRGKCGRLLFAEGRHRDYGYTEDRDFAAAVRSGQVAAKTAVGAVSLGKFRCLPDEVKAPDYLTVTRKDLPVNLDFYSCSPAETSGMVAIIQKMFPGARVHVSKWKLATSFVLFPSWRPALRALQGTSPVARAVRIIWAGALASCMLIVVPWTSTIPFWLVVFAPVVFFLVLVAGLRGLPKGKSVS